jgi:hypothetical protein
MLGAENHEEEFEILHRFRSGVGLTFFMGFRGGLKFFAEI